MAYLDYPDCHIAYFEHHTVEMDYRIAEYSARNNYCFAEAVSIEIVNTAAVNIVAECSAVHFEAVCSVTACSVTENIEAYNSAACFEAAYSVAARSVVHSVTAYSEAVNIESVNIEAD
ncbi:hypothetical protein [Gardnerella vaginalis]|uniref:hypothetical protein n=1 Tax=Gardnerella TaxID=2701 RepID=UPI0039EE981E